ncbi:MAG: zinc-ribbon domain-containing protein [Firmicutes bacterium]|nr:zinc-ribbon domain-containing protein [Bacillota bacterium]
MRQTLFGFCTENHREALLTEWDAAHNVPLTPETVTYGSRKLVRRCCGEGHRYFAMVCSRVRVSGCPYCANRALLSASLTGVGIGENYFASNVTALVHTPRTSFTCRTARSPTLLRTALLSSTPPARSRKRR